MPDKEESIIGLESLRDPAERPTASDTQGPHPNSPGPEHPPRHPRLLQRFCIVQSPPAATAYPRRLRWGITYLVAAAAAIDSTATNIFYSTSLPDDQQAGARMIDRFLSLN